tara:strand:+ start:1935 stop:3035 length:1101 start_codon:yes stop_codon:yes gene_type:complete
MANLKNRLKSKDLHFLSLAFEQAKINLGSTKTNPSVGCVVEKNNSVISTGKTSLNGRPHAEFNALNKKKNFKNATVYLTLEPCSHHGKTPPCTNLISKKKIRRVIYSVSDVDLRSKSKSKKILIKKKIIVKDNILKNMGLSFYESYYIQHSSKIPLIDAKIACSKDYFTKNLGNKWITNDASLKRSHLLRSMYDCIISTSKSINDDNSLLNCRIEGIENKSPDLIILDRNLKLKKNLKLFNIIKNRNIFLFTSKFNSKKINFLKKRGIKVFVLKSLKSNKDFTKFFLILKNKGYNRIFVESGLTFLNFLIKNRFLKNIYIFKSSISLKKTGLNNANKNLLKKIKLKNLIKVYLYGDKLYKERLNYV